MRRESIKAVLQRAVSSLSLCSTMKAAGALIVLLWCLSEAGAQEQSGQTELWDQVKQLRDMGLVQGEKLKTMEAKLTASEAEVQELRDTVVEQGNTLVVQAEKLKDVEEDTKEQRDLVSDLRMELAIAKYQMKGMAK